MRISKFENLLSGPVSFYINFSKRYMLNWKYLFTYLQQQIKITYYIRSVEIACLKKGLIFELNQNSILKILDRCWKNYLQTVISAKGKFLFRESEDRISLVEYKKEMFTTFAVMMVRFRHQIILKLLSFRSLMF